MSAPGAVDRVRVGAFAIPTDFPESDGTLEWSKTTLIVVELGVGDAAGLGFTYGDPAIALLLSRHAPGILGELDANRIAELGARFVARLRNEGRGGIVAMAQSAIDVALWDLKARRLGRSVAEMLGMVRDACPAYGSGGFTSYPNDRLQEQFARWRREGFTRFKMKVGRNPESDPGRAGAAREVIGPVCQLYVDANSAYGRQGPREALEWGRRYAEEFGVTWYEEPLAPRDLAGLRFLRERLPGAIRLAEGEYAYERDDFRELVESRAVDVIMADATRCGGVTGFLQAAALCDAFRLPLSSHCSPLLHAHLGCVAAPFVDAEYFHDHARIERMLFEGVAEVKEGALRPPVGSPGFGWAFRWEEAKRFEVSGVVVR